MSNNQAEAKAILKVVIHQKKKTQVSKILESDSLVMLTILKGKIKPLLQIVEIVEEIIQHVQTQQITIQQIFTEGNQLADYLANKTLQEDKTMVFEEFMHMPKMDLRSLT